MKKHVFFFVVCICIFGITSSVFSSELISVNTGSSFDAGADWADDSLDGSISGADDTPTEISVSNTGWYQENGKWYYLNEYYIPQTGWLYDYPYWYYLDPDGAMATGWRYINSRWYCFDTSGSMLTGWQMIDGSWYYFLPDMGYMVSDGWITDPSGKACYLDSSGKYVAGNLTWIGDSISAIASGQAAINYYFYYPEVYSQISRGIYSDLPGIPSGLTVAVYLADAGIVHDYLVFQLGSNLDFLDPYVTTTQKINELIRIVGSDTKIILVTAYLFNDWYTDLFYGANNNELKALASTNPNIAVADWASICNPASDLSDYAHPSYYGAYKYMALIRDTLVNNFGAH